MPALAAFSEAVAALKQGRGLDAVPLLEAALVAEPEHALARLNLGMALMDIGRLDSCEPHLQEAAAALPHMAEPQFRLGRLAHLRGDLAAARQGYEAALLRRGDHVPALAGLGVVEQAEGRPLQAEALLREALLHAPGDSSVMLELARSRMSRGEHLQALEEIEAVLEREPEHGQAGLLWTDALVQAHGHAAARERMERAIAADPFGAARVAGLAAMLDGCGAPSEALAQWRLAEALAPQDGQILSGLGHALWRQRSYQEARAVFERAVAILPQDRKIRVALGEQLFRTHRLAEAAETLRRAMRELGPDYRGNATLALVEVAQGLQDQALGACEAAGGENELLLRLCSLGPYHDELSRPLELRAVADRLHAGLSTDLLPYQAPARAGRERLRIGLLSAHFGTHPVGWLTLPGIEALPREEMELVILSLGDREGPLARRFRERADRWIAINPGITERGLVDMLRAEEFDILIDLGGHGHGGRVRALRHRCAPVQIKWVGSQSATTGVPNVDWMLTDRWETPAGFEAQYTERLLRLPDGYVCYLPPPHAPEVGPAPILARGHVTFGCFNNLAKVTPGLLACWERIMRALPDARLVLRTHALGDAPTRAAFEARAGEAGLPMDRVEMHSALPHGELLAAYGGIDISLDPFPYNGGLTVCESLWMGVPVLARIGEHFAGRHAFSHLSNVGLADWAEADEQGYVRQAIRRAADPAALAALRAGLRARVAASPLCDGPRFGAGLAEALRRAWSERPGKG
ncbi:tetratricopeptide repeat protein [Roseococcus sp. YIM B11640]|uniref:tetratricopeptide repeat protein n=1 Tax=Roseococcus sp. YIM B11640 TaxID=3133973 RepID=UPI003C7A9AD1